MGGAALLIYGNVSDELLKPRPIPRTIMDRLLGRTRMQTIAWSSFGRDRRMVDLPSASIESIGAAFVDDVTNRFKPPWAATASVIEYLRLGVTSVYVRGDATAAKPPEWYVQLTFSGCAGMAEVSAELAAHWADRWYAEKKSDIASKFFGPYGFVPNGRTERAASAPMFVPLGVAGYALYSPKPKDTEEEDLESKHFDIDFSAMETLAEEERESAMRSLDEKLPPLLPTSGCSCQWCAPDFDAAACDRVSGFV